jgi:hypothetical protein
MYAACPVSKRIQIPETIAQEETEENRSRIKLLTNMGGRNRR